MPKPAKTNKSSSRGLVITNLVVVFAIVAGVYIFKNNLSLNPSKYAANSSLKYAKIVITNDGKFISKSTLDTKPVQQVSTQDSSIKPIFVIKNSLAKSLITLQNIPQYARQEAFLKNGKLDATYTKTGEEIVIQSDSNTIENLNSIELQNTETNKVINLNLSDKVNTATTYNVETILTNSDYRDSTKALDILFVDVQFGKDQNALFRQTAKNYADSLMLSSYFKDNKNRINIKRLDSYATQEDFGCYATALSISCNNSNLMNYFRYYADSDYIVLIVKNNLPSAMQYMTVMEGDSFTNKPLIIDYYIDQNPIYSGYPVLAHGLAHILADLEDEHLLLNSPLLPNHIKVGQYRLCRPDCNFEKGFCYKGCGISTLYRSSDKSLMAFNSPNFNALSMDYLNRAIEKYAPFSYTPSSVGSKLIGLTDNKLQLPVKLSWTKPTNPSATNQLIGWAEPLDNQGVFFDLTFSKGISDYTLSSLDLKRTLKSGVKIKLELRTIAPNPNGAATTFKDTRILTSSGNYAKVMSDPAFKNEYCAGDMKYEKDNSIPSTSRIDILDIQTMQKYIKEKCNTSSCIFERACPNLSTYCKGDPNGDGKVNLLDLTWASTHYGVEHTYSCAN